VLHICGQSDTNIEADEMYVRGVQRRRWERSTRGDRFNTGSQTSKNRLSFRSRALSGADGEPSLVGT
jgi:hypothetical protein